MNAQGFDRRSFLAAAGSAVAGLTISGDSVDASAARRVPLRCGFVGVGGRGSALLRNTLEIEGVDVAAICDIDPTNRGRACELAEKTRGTRPDETDDWKKLLARDDISAVVSALPCDLHFPMYRDTLAAGKHLYGEKPMCLSAAHADALVRQSKSAGKVFQVGFQRRFSEPFKSAVQLCRDGIIGKPFEARGVRFGTGGPHRKPGEWFSFRERSGDWMLEQAVHNFDAFTWALGELPVSAFGTGRQDLFRDWDPQRDVSDYYTAVLQYKSGLTLTWTHTWAAPPHPHFAASHEQIIGPKGGIDLSKGFVSFRKDAAPDGNATRQLDAQDRRDSTLFALQGFFDCCRSGKPPAVGAREGRDATLFGLLVRKAVYELRVVTMDEVLSA